MSRLDAIKGLPAMLLLPAALLLAFLLAILDWPKLESAPRSKERPATF